MFTNLKPYPAYQDSGQPWFGPIPSSWHPRGARTLFTEVTNVGHDDEDMLSVTIGRGIIRQSDLIWGTSKKDSSNLDKSRYKLVEPGDIAYNKMRAWQGALGLSQHRGIVSPAYIVMRVREGSGIYFHHLLRTPGFAKEAERWSYGISSDQWSLRSEHFKLIYFPFPPEADQTAIVKYLGHANARIHRAIAAKRSLIALLEEQNQAIINQAVTRGLDPTVPLKDSGIPWLDQVPAHWPIAALRHRYSQSLGKMLDSGRIVGHDLLPYLRNTDVQWDRVNTLDLPEMDISDAEFHRYTLEAGDLLVCEGGDVGRAAIWEGVKRVGYQKALHRLRPADTDKDVPRYLLYGLRVASRAGAFSDGHVSTIAHLTGEKLRAHRFAWPPASEQQSIVDHLDSSTASTDRTIDRVSHEVELLKEFRTRLTADVVTGQVDIRAAAARLPEMEPANLMSDVGEQDEDDLDAELAESLGQVDA